LLDEGLAGLGRCPVQPLPADADAWLGGRLADTDADAFVAAPDWHGEPRETTPFARGLTEPLVADLVRRHGNGLLPRLAALLAELARACCVLTGDEHSGVQHRPSGEPGAGVGLGAAQAARGLLLHRVETADGRITGYRILAPTEWNFHPHGIVAVGLAAIAAAGPDEPAELERLARLHISAIDPCVAYTLSVS
jgi:coenzyme F420-reducing hydrogenase alpha subunit